LEKTITLKTIQAATPMALLCSRPGIARIDGQLQAGHIDNVDYV